MGPCHSLSLSHSHSLCPSSTSRASFYPWAGLPYASFVAGIAAPDFSWLPVSSGLFLRTSSNLQAAEKGQAFHRFSFLVLPQVLKAQHPFAPGRFSYRSLRLSCRYRPASFRRSCPADPSAAGLSDPVSGLACSCLVSVAPGFVVVARSSFPVPGVFSALQVFRCSVLSVNPL